MNIKTNAEKGKLNIDINATNHEELRERTIMLERVYNIALSITIALDTYTSISNNHLMGSISFILSIGLVKAKELYRSAFIDHYGYLDETNILRKGDALKIACTLWALFISAHVLLNLADGSTTLPASS